MAKAAKKAKKFTTVLKAVIRRTDGTPFADSRIRFYNQSARGRNAVEREILNMHGRLQDMSEAETK